jgi:hypothetical protein
VVPPCHQGELVDLVDAFPALLALPLHPVPVQVRTYPVQDLAAELVLLPLTRVKLQNSLAHPVHPIAQQGHQVVPEELPDAFVELEAHELRAAPDLALLVLGGDAGGAAAVGLLVHRRAVVIDVRVELYVEVLRHVLLAVCMFDSCVQVAPNLVQIDLFEACRIIDGIFIRHLLRSPQESRLTLVFLYHNKNLHNIYNY